jgi:CCR4-NOT transcriptional regulation complex NOT5 subunit
VPYSCVGYILAHGNFQVAEEVHEDLAAVEHKHETHKMKKATWEMVLNNFPERGIPVSYASEYEVGKYYGEHVEVNGEYVEVKDRNPMLTCRAECSNKSSDATKDSSKADSEQHKRPAEEEPEESEGHPSKKARMEQEPGSASQGPDEDSDADSTPTTRTPPLNQLALKPMS